MTCEARPEPGLNSDPFPEYKIKAVFLYNFIRYTTWPEEALGKKGEPIVLLVVGEDRFGSVLTDTFEDKKLHDRAVSIRHVEAPPEKIEAQLIFACGLDEEQEAALLKACSGVPILLIGDEAGFAERGACADFFVKDKKVRFEVNTGVVKASKLTVSSQLLKLARIVESKEEKR